MGRYIGDAKFGRHVGTDELGNRYFENMNPSEEVPGTSYM
jgi:NADH dehydrogenase (ubiquinone) 1 alpha subcomplex subunit 12